MKTFIKRRRRKKKQIPVDTSKKEKNQESNQQLGSSNTVKFETPEKFNEKG